MPALECALVGIAVENLRGFRRAELTLDRDVTFLVGPNNSGKTSLLRLLDWVINGDILDLVTQGRELTLDEEQLLLPARETRGAARRLTLQIRIGDGRTARSFNARQGVASLRFRVIGRSVYVATSRPKKSEERKSEPNALRLLDALRGSMSLILIPAARSAESMRFEESLRNAIRERLAERALHSEQGGAPVEYRRVRSALQHLENIALTLVNPLWVDMREVVAPGLARDGRFSFEADPEALVDWIVSRILFTLGTGEHDEKGVSPIEVGSGLQSLLDVGLVHAMSAGASSRWLLIEEPEAFLHPAAQRAVAGILRSYQGAKRVISTHSPVIAEESDYGEIVLVRNHKIYEPKAVDAQRAAINTAYISGPGAEALFSRSVLLVEGAGDKALFEALRRRLAGVDPSGRVHELMVVDVGGKSRFGPWIELFRSYASRDGDLPVRWTVLADAIDASSSIAECFEKVGIALPSAVDAELKRIPKLFGDGDVAGGIRATERLNVLARDSGLGLALAPVDLEYLVLGGVSDSACERLGEELGIGRTNRKALLKELGSKAVAGASSDGKKPWMRSVIGRKIPRAEISDQLKGVLSIWLSGAIDDENVVRALLAKMPDE